MRRWVPGALVLALGLGSGGCRKDEPKPQDQAAPTEAEALAKSDLPAARPPDASMVFQVEHGRSDLAYLWLKSDGSIYSRQRDAHRIQLHYDASPAELDRLYGILRANAFDKIETVPSRGEPRPGLMLELTIGKRRFVVLDKNNLYPKARWAESYDACARAMQAAAPTPDPERSWVELRIELDPELSDAAVEASLGPDLVGLRWLEDQPNEPVVLVGRYRTVEVSAEQPAPPPPEPGTPEAPPPEVAKAEVDLSHHRGVRVIADGAALRLEPIVGSAIVHGTPPGAAPANGG